MDTKRYEPYLLEVSAIAPEFVVIRMSDWKQGSVFMTLTSKWNMRTKWGCDEARSVRVYNNPILLPLLRCTFQMVVSGGWMMRSVMVSYLRSG